MEQTIWSMPSGILGPFIAGLALGLFYFAGLWFTTSRLTQTGNPALLFSASFAGRMMVLIAGIHLISNGQWQRIAACLVGVVLMRVLLTRHLAPRTAPATHLRR
jgi:F1F0 ATPase subunit 2